MATPQAPACSFTTPHVIPDQQLQSRQLTMSVEQDRHDNGIQPSRWITLEPISAQLQPSEATSALWAAAQQSQLSQVMSGCAQQHSSGATTKASLTSAEVARSRARRASLKEEAEGAGRQTGTLSQMQTEALAQTHAETQRPPTAGQLQAPENVRLCRTHLLAHQHSAEEHRSAPYGFEIAVGDSDIPHCRQTGELDSLDCASSIECSVCKYVLAMGFDMRLNDASDASPC